MRPLLFVITLFLLLGKATEAGAQNRPFPRELEYPAAVKPQCCSQEQLNSRTAEFYDYWKSAYVRESNGATPGGRFVEYHPEPGYKTVSEAHGYGMIITVLMAGYDSRAREQFDGFYAFYNDHRSTGDEDLMSWEVAVDEDPQEDQDSATDGDLDIAYALLLAHYQWGSQGDIDYLGEAQRLISQGVAAAEINHRRFMLGDWWHWEPQQWGWATRSSDWLPDHCRAFAAATGDTLWEAVTATVYDLVETVTAEYAPQTGLLPDFVDGEEPAPAPPWFLEDEYDGAYNWNACRVPWRLAVDFAHYGTPAAAQALERMAAWIESAVNGDPAAVAPGYLLDGTPIPDRPYTSLAFTAPLVAAAMVSGEHQEFLDAGWELLAAEDEGAYFGDTLKLLVMLLLSGNWWPPVPDPPAAPAGLELVYGTEGAVLSWDPVVHTLHGAPLDGVFYRVYGAGEPGFGAPQLLGTTAQTMFTDSDGGALRRRFYRVSAEETRTHLRRKVRSTPTPTRKATSTNSGP